MSLSVRANPQAKSARSAGVAIITACVVPLQVIATATSSGSDLAVQPTVAVDVAGRAIRLFHCGCSVNRRAGGGFRSGTATARHPLPPRPFRQMEARRGALSAEESSDDLPPESDPAGSWGFRAVPVRTERETSA